MLQIRILRRHLVSQSKRLLLNRKYFEQYRQIFLTTHLLCKSNVQEPLILNANQAASDYPDEFLEETKDSPKIRMVDELRYPKLLETFNSSDSMTMHINKCDEISTLVSFIRENGHLFNANHACNALLMIREFHRQEKKNLNLLPDNNPDYIEMLDLVSHHIKEFTLDEVTCSLLAMSIIKVPVENKTFQLLLSHFQDYITELQDDVPLIFLVRYSLAIHNFAMEYWTYINFLPMYNLILNKLSECTTAYDVYLCTLCLHSHRELVTDSVLSNYQTVIQKMLDENKLNSDHSEILVAILTFLNHPQWRTQNNDIMRNIMIQFRGKVHLLDVKLLVELFKIFFRLQEPSYLVHEFQDSALTFLKGNLSITMKSALARYLIPFAFGPYHQEFQTLLNKNLHLQSVENDMSVQDFVRLYQTFRTPAVNTFYAIWSKMQALITSNNPKIIGRLLRLCFSYTYYIDQYNNLHRHLGFEKEIIKWLMEDLESGESNFLTWKCVRAAGFILAYYPTNETENAIPDIVIDKLVSMSEQYNLFNCLYITQCYSIAQKIRKRQKHSIKLIDQLNQVDEMLDEYMERVLRSKTLDVIQVSLLMRCFAYKEFKTDNDFYKKLELRTKELDGNITSQIIREITLSTTQNQYILPQLMEKAVKYIIDNREHIMAQTVGCFVITCYTLGYKPKDNAAFVAAVNEIMYRERDRVTGKLLIEVALSLCYLHHLPNEFIRYIFNMDFLQKLDDEIMLNKSHLSYSGTLRHCLMKLNRTVCLEYPEEDVPWFHKKYCEEGATRDYRNTTLFYKEVHETLAVLVNEKHIRVDAYSPYYHKIHFLVQSNESTKNVNHRGTALLLHGPNSFSSNGNYLKGVFSMNKSQLQILGYNVITLNHFTWNSLALSEPSAKLKYLSDRLEGKSEEVF